MRVITQYTESTSPNVNFSCHRFVAKDEISGTSQLKSSVQRGIRTKIQEQYPNIQPYIDEILPKKESIVLVKWYTNELIKFIPRNPNVF